MIIIQEDFSLFDDFREGSRKALDRYIAHYGKGIHYLLEKKTGSAKVAKEATVEAFTILYHSRHTIESPAQLWSFLYSTATKVAAKHAAGHDGSDIDLFKPLEERRSIADKNEKKKLDVIMDPGLARAIEKLTPRQKEVAACYRAGMKTRQIADFLGIASQTVLNHKTHGSKQLKLAFGENWIENNPFRHS